MRSFRTTKLALGLVAVLAVLLALVVPAGAAKKQSSEPVTLRLGYFPNVTHAPAIVGVEEELFEKALGNERHPRALDVQLRHRGAHRVPGRRARRQLHRPQPHHHRVDASSTRA